MFLRGDHLIPEFQSLDGYVLDGVNAPTFSTTEKATDTHSLRFGPLTDAIGIDGFSLSQFRGAYWFKHNGGDGTLFKWFHTDSGFYSDIVRSGGNLLFRYNEVTIESVADTPIANIDTWYHLGIAINIDPGEAPIYVTLYVNGVSVLSGTTFPIPTIPEANFSKFFWCGPGWNNFAYADDFYADVIFSEADQPLPNIRFIYLSALAAGVQIDGTPHGAVSNLLCINQAPHDDDTTYVEINATGDKDVFTHAPLTLPTDYTISNVMPMGYAKTVGSLDDGDANILPILYNQSEFLEDSNWYLLDTYTHIWNLFPEQFDASPWTETDVNATQFGYEGGDNVSQEISVTSFAMVVEITSDTFVIEEDDEEEPPEEPTIWRKNQSLCFIRV